MKIDSEKIIFIHIPRTGGSSIENILYKKFIEKYFIENFDFKKYVDFFPDLKNHFENISVPIFKYPKNKKHEWGKNHYIESGIKENRYPQLLNKGRLVGWSASTNSWLQHLTSKEIINTISKKSWNKYFKFAFVRNPWSRAVSEWSYLCRESRKSFKNHTLKDFLLERGFFQDIKFKKGPGNRASHFKDQYSFTHNNYQLALDFVGKFENYEKDFEKFCNINSLELGKVPHFNEGFRIRSNYLRKSQKPSKKLILPEDKKYRMYYSPETKKIVAEKYARDIETFEYEF